VINGVNYSMRYRPMYQKMKRMVDAGDFGKVLSVWARTFRGHGFYSTGHRHRAVAEPEESGGWIVHHMCHIVDFAIWLAGAVEEVYTLTLSTAPPELDSEEMVYATVKFANGAIGTLADQVGSLRDHSAGVIGEKGGCSEINEGVKPLLRVHYETDIEFRPPHVVDPTDGLVVEDWLKHFLRCLREGVATNVPVSEAEYSLKVCHAMRRSAHEGGPVQID